jgi:predicted murein hydrolase (TIGR00659 family)
MIPADLQTIWVYLAATPLLGLTLTLAAYLLGQYVFLKGKMSPLLNPVLLAVLILILLLRLTGTQYQTYFQGAQFVHFLLGPATVALAIPLYRQLHTLRRSLLAVAAGLLAGSVTAAASAMLAAKALGASQNIVLSMAPKSATMPIAMGVSEQIGGLPSLTAAMVLLTGIFGAVAGVAILDRLRIKSAPARGLAMGVASHGIGTARALLESETAGAFSGLAMGMNGVVTTLVVPLLVRFLFP